MAQQQQPADPRGTGHREIEKVPRKAVGNAGTLVGIETVKGVPTARFRAEPGTWVSASMKSLGYDRLYGGDEAYGAYRGIAKSPSGQSLSNPDRLAPGQEYLVPLPQSPAHPSSTKNNSTTRYAGRNVTDQFDIRRLSQSPELRTEVTPQVSPAGALRLNPNPEQLLRPPPYLRLLPDPPPEIVGPWGSLAELGPLGLALLAAGVTAWSLYRGREQAEERVREREEELVRERGLTSKPKQEPPQSLTKAPTPLRESRESFIERVRRALIYHQISFDEYLTALNTGSLVVQSDKAVATWRSGPPVSEAFVATHLLKRLADFVALSRAATKKKDKALAAHARKLIQATIEEVLKLPHGLTHIAVQLKRLMIPVEQKYATVEVGAAQNKKGEKSLVAGINSSSKWTPEQIAECERLGIIVAPRFKGLQKNQPHAEENIFAHLKKAHPGKSLFKMSNAPVGAGKPGSPDNPGSDVCPVCRRLIAESGAGIEPDMHELKDLKYIWDDQQKRVIWVRPLNETTAVDASGQVWFRDPLTGSWTQPH